MGCDCQTTATAFAADPCRRVNYTLGMILGVDDFVQESVYHSSHREALARLAIGYGTLSGLDVTLEPSAVPGSTETQVRVTKGTALAPSGKLVHVDAEQCCSVSDWARLEKNHALVLENPDGSQTRLPKVETRPGSAGSWARAWVTLAFSESKCAEVPLPGDPCRTDDKLTAPSRVEDGFHLDITWQRPDQKEEDALRRYFEWVCRIPVQPDGADLTEFELLAAIRAEAKKGLPTTGAPTSVPEDYFAGTPSKSLHYKGELLRAVMRLWITEIRPLWFSCCPGDDPAGWDTVLLSGLWIPVATVAEDWVFDGSRAVELEQTHRPSLLSLRALQEMVRRLEDQFYSIIPKPATSVKTESVFGLPPVPGMEDKYARADHTHGTPKLPALARDLSGSLGDGGGSAPIEVVGLRGVAIDPALPSLSGQILSFNGAKWAPSLPAPLAGDAVGAPGANKVGGLRGIPLAAVNPAKGQVLSFDGTSWAPSTPPSALDAGGDLSGTTATAKVVGIRGVPILDVDPSYGQILGYDGKYWKPQPPPEIPPAGGDVVGSLPETKVVGIQGVPVAPVAPSPGQILSFDGYSWKPAEAPPSEPDPVVAEGDVIGPIGSNTTARIRGIPVLEEPPAYGQILAYDGKYWKPQHPGFGGGIPSFACGQVVVLLSGKGLAIDVKVLFADRCEVKLVKSEVPGFLLQISAYDATAETRRLVNFTPIWSENAVNARLSLEPRGEFDIVHGETGLATGDGIKGTFAFQFQIFQTPITAV